jgi:hypothetical protein
MSPMVMDGFIEAIKKCRQWCQMGPLILLKNATNSLRWAQQGYV